MNAPVKWCRWCGEEHAIDVLCDQAASALSDMANLAEGSQPLHHYPPDTDPEALGIGADTEPIGGLGFSGGAIEINGRWQVMLVLHMEGLDGNKFPPRALITPVSGFERLREWTVKLMDETIAKTKELNEEGK